MESTAPEEFERQLVCLLPDMRVWALAFTRNASAADDLVQDVATKVLTNRSSFDPGSNFSAWVRRIMVNHFISSLRTRREFVSIEEMPEVPVAAGQQAKLDLDRLNAEIARLPDYQRELLCQIAVEERSYHCCVRKWVKPNIINGLVKTYQWVSKDPGARENLVISMR